MRQYLPPWLRALTAAPGTPDADFDWGEWSAQVFREMRAHWLSYFVLIGIMTTVFSCASAQIDAQAASSSGVRDEAKHDPWALDEKRGDVR